jgi:hypothetical protein
VHRAFTRVRVTWFPMRRFPRSPRPSARRFITDLHQRVVDIARRAGVTHGRRFESTRRLSGSAWRHRRQPLAALDLRQSMAVTLQATVGGQNAIEVRRSQARGPCNDCATPRSAVRFWDWIVRMRRERGRPPRFWRPITNCRQKASSDTDAGMPLACGTPVCRHHRTVKKRTRRQRRRRCE